MDGDAYGVKLSNHAASWELESALVDGSKYVLPGNKNNTGHLRGSGTTTRSKAAGHEHVQVRTVFEPTLLGYTSWTWRCTTTRTKIVEMMVLAMKS
jgi:hypothetical protein